LIQNKSLEAFYVSELDLKLINIIRKAPTFLIRFYLARIRGYCLVCDISTLSRGESAGVSGSQNKLPEPGTLQILFSNEFCYYSYIRKS
jgi:hypothetical protein